MAVFSLEKLVQSVTRQDQTSLDFCAKLHIPNDLLAFDGHFPDEPILPGIVQLQIVRELIEQQLDQPLTLHAVPKARMSQMVLPNDDIEIDVKLKHEAPNEQLDSPHYFAKVVIKKDDKIASRVRFLLKPNAV